jgi:hypothetical protein
MRRLLLFIVLLGPVVLTAAPTPPSGQAQAWLEGERLRVSRRVMFRSGELQVTPDSRAVLTAMAKTLKGLPADRLIVVEGHSDAGGDETENLLLSRARAEYVVTALIRLGVDATRLRAEGVGSARPLVALDHPEKYRNRRIEVYFLPLEAEYMAPMTSALPTAPLVIPMLDEPAATPPRSWVVPLLDDAQPVKMAGTFAVPLLDEPDAGLDLLPPRSFHGGAPRIPLLVDGDTRIGLVD